MYFFLSPPYLKSFFGSEVSNTWVIEFIIKDQKRHLANTHLNATYVAVSEKASFHVITMFLPITFLGINKGSFGHCFMELQYLLLSILETFNCYTFSKIIHCHSESSYYISDVFYQLLLNSLMVTGACLESRSFDLGSC